MQITILNSVLVSCSSVCGFPQIANGFKTSEISSSFTTGIGEKGDCTAK